MENDWDLQLSHQIDSHPNLQQQGQIEPDLMLQPITTQEKFNIVNKNNQSPSPNKKSELNSGKQFKSGQEDLLKQKSLKESHDLADEARKFRQYLNDKVQQLKKSKDQVSFRQNPSPQAKSKTSNLRKIINKEELKSRQNYQQKPKNSSEKANISKPINLVNKTAVEIKKANQTSASSVGTYKNISTKKEDGQKRFSNSQSSLAKNVQKKDVIQSKNTTVTDIKKSINLDNNSKTPKLPELTPKLKIPFPTKNEPNSTQQRIDKRKNTIDQVIPRENLQKQKRRTPQSKNSFRIKRTSNASNIQANAQLSQQKLSVEIKKSNQVSQKTIQKEKPQQSPVHQGKNRKMREDFVRFNEEERKIQEEILKNHQTSKQSLDGMMKKYQLSINAYQKYGIRKQAQFPNEPQPILTSPKKSQQKQSRLSPSQKQLPSQQVPKQSTLKKQQRKNAFLSQQLQKINTHLKARQTNIKKYQSRVDRNPLIQFIRSMPQDILQQSQQQDDDKVQQLPGQSNLKQDSKYDIKQFSSTYTTVMTEMKNKKWGLKQRITFETHREQQQLAEGGLVIGGKKSSFIGENLNINLSSNKKPQENSRLPQTINDQDNTEPYSKIEVNSRLKNLLLD